MRQTPSSFDCASTARRRGGHTLTFSGTPFGTQPMLSKARLRQAIEETLQRIQLNQLIGWPACSSRLTLQVEIPPTGYRLLGGTYHSTNSNALRTARSAP
jgi:hypothetical protein